MCVTGEGTILAPWDALLCLAESRAIDRVSNNANDYPGTEK